MTSTRHAIENHQREWDVMAREDPYWAVLSTPEAKFGGWDPAEFLGTGEQEVAAVMSRARAFGRPRRRGRALDFGSGMGRATAALAERFDEVVGVDMSETMVARASALHQDRPNCRFALNAAPDLKAFENESFDLVYSRIVLQHQPTAEAIERYIGEFVRVLRSDGLLVFQLPSRLPLAVRLQPRRTLYRLLARLGLSSRTLYWRLGLHPMRMRALPERSVGEVVTRAGAHLLAVDSRHDPEYGFDDSLYFVARA
jgi:SAM-dependent methyltransferase